MPRRSFGFTLAIYSNDNAKQVFGFQRDSTIKFSDLPGRTTKFFWRSKNLAPLAQKSCPASSREHRGQGSQDERDSTEERGALHEPHHC
jgi:hypothetical protein